MQIIHYPHPTLRHRSKPVMRVDAELRAIVAEMFELMYAARGVGLAANQVDLPIRLFIANLEGAKGEGEERVFINPVVSRPKGTHESEEGCLSLPGLYGNVRRPKTVRVQAYNLQGQEIDEEVGGMLARVIQHETDHLDGVLFIDRLSETGKLSAREAIEEFEDVFASRRRVGEIPSDETLAAQRLDWEKKYC